MTELEMGEKPDEELYTVLYTVLL